ncbi:signal peptidase I [Paenibacillus crassostreae]|uniref:Signal peptidase I n=1 Tax=Paenibacillus crassostreae TaxID=1763538 RepID=A0A167AIF0_9BACL|nr:signal peptidase I [Paenibacillus crassostreae]AOZ92349.1 signal peptidase I [Paenibacillus crassostreae]OAB71064.1 S26 family signal peptidase [Paenibacillus crassostreae]
MDRNDLLDGAPLDSSSSPSSSPNPTVNDKKSGWKAELWDWIKTLVVVFVVMSLLNMFVFNLSMVKGQSMQPTLVERERLFINKIIYNFSSPQKGEIVVLHDPSRDDTKKEFLVKRIIGVPGDVVEVKDHQLYINGQLQQEDYIDISIQDADFSGITIGEDEYFVMGDNRHLGESKDSRYFGAVNSDSIVGRAEFIFWPFNKVRGL